MHWVERDYGLSAGQHTVLPKDKGRSKVDSNVILTRTKNKLLILPVNRHPVYKGRKIAGDKSAFFYAFAIFTINKQL